MFESKNYDILEYPDLSLKNEYNTTNINEGCIDWEQNDKIFVPVQYGDTVNTTLYFKTEPIPNNTINTIQESNNLGINQLD